MSSPCLVSLAPELLQQIAFFAAEPLGPPAALLSLLLTCRGLYEALSFHSSPYLYDRIFRLKFDLVAPRRRLGADIAKSSILANELRKRCAVLQRIRRCNVFSRHVRDDLWLAYLMMLESDGRNEEQLTYWACIRKYVVTFMASRLKEGSDTNGGWPVENEVNSLIVWLLWLTNDADNVASEPENLRVPILIALQPYFVAAFKYSPFFYPDTHFYLPLHGTPETNPPRSRPTVHGMYPIYRAPLPAGTPTFEHFGVPLTLCAPPLTPAAILCHGVRRERRPLSVPRGLPARRADLAPGAMGRTQEDYVEYNTRSVTRCIPRRRGVRRASFLDDADAMEVDKAPAAFTSRAHDHEWLRASRCFNPWLDAKLKTRIYTPGMLDGLWEGRLFAFNLLQYDELACNPVMPPHLSETFPLSFQYPVYMNLREHHCLPPHDGASCKGGGLGRYDDGLNNAWFNRGTEFVEKQGKLHVFDHIEEETTVYETFVPGRANSHAAAGGCAQCSAERHARLAQPALERLFCEEGLLRDELRDDCIRDIVITGETDFEHGRAWDFYRVYGRVRDSDGLVVLIRIPQRPNTIGAGTYVFRGYIHSGQNFCGRWRAAAGPAHMISDVEGTFSLCKRVP